MRTSTIWFLLILASLPCSAFNEEFMIGVSTDRRVYQLGEAVEITFTLTNATADMQYLKFDGNACFSYSLWIEDSQGEEVARGWRVCSFGFDDGRYVEPFSSFPISVYPWWQNVGDFSFLPLPPDAEQVPPGTYRVVVDWHLKNRSFSAPFVICNGQCPEPRSLVIPAAGNNPGLYGTQWTTDLGFQGLGGGDTLVTVSMFEHGSPGYDVPSVELAVPDLATLHITNVLETLFDHEGKASLHLEIRGGDIHVHSRTMNTSDSGTFGQAVPAVEPKTGRTAILVPGLKHADGAWRTNLGIINLLSIETTLDIELNTGLGSTVAVESVTLGPHEYRQLNDVFRDLVDPQTELLTASARISVPQYGWGIFMAYGSVIDNRTGDAVFVPGIPARGEQNLY